MFGLEVSYFKCLLKLKKVFFRLIIVIVKSAWTAKMCILLLYKVPFIKNKNSVIIY